MDELNTTSIANVIAIIFGIIVFVKSYQLLFLPMHILRDDTSQWSKRKNRKMMTRKQNRKLGNLPPVFPNGWFKLLFSNEIGKGEVKGVYALGEHFAVFRNSNGTVRILNAYCPHMGADMAIGGVVSGDCLRCPFHGWEFSGTNGKCVSIPYSKRDFVKVRSYHVQEVNGIICVWYDSDHNVPKWENPVINKLPSMKYVGNTEHVVYGHIQDVSENAADFSHLNYLHKPLLHSHVGANSNVMDFVRHDIKANWKPSSDFAHMSLMDIVDSTHLYLFNKKWHLKNFIFHIKQIGPGVVHLYMNTPWMRGVLIQTTTPIAPMKLELSHVYYTDQKVPMFIAKLFLYFQSIQIDRDVAIWNNKTYCRNPTFVKEESLIAEHRKWYRQFYSETSPTIFDIIQQNDDTLSW